MKIDFSVAIVTWNRAEELKRALDSCVKQSYKPIEIVIVDNDSTDETSEVVANFKDDAQDNLISLKYIKIHKNIGCPPARNIALANCTGDYIYALDDDGYLDVDALYYINKTILLSIPSKQPVIVSSQIRTPQKENIGFSSTDLCKRNIFSAGACAYRRTYLAKGNYFPEYFRQMEESRFAYKAWFDGEVILFQPLSVMYHEKTLKGRSMYLEVKYNFLHDIENISSQVGFLSSLLIFPIKTISHFKSYAGLRSFSTLFFIKDFFIALFKLFLTKKEMESSFFEYLNFSKGKTRV
ncbi:glycosyltransferase family 2 protein [Shewanella baltica]|uniref:glycosyltransferase family 2 protein n=1 Tax=Shewanella baltica TaxID=62322 RepID=UPI003D7ACBF3